MPTGPSPDLDELRRQLSRAVARLCPQRLSADREDIVQVALMRLHRKSEGIEGSDPPPASYIWKTAFSVVVDEIRRRDRRPESPLDDTAVADEVADALPDAEQRAIARDLGRVIRGCLGALTGSRRAAVVLHLQGHTVPQIGRLLGHDEKKADNLVYRGMNDLRECLKSKGVDR